MALRRDALGKPEKGDRDLILAYGRQLSRRSMVNWVATTLGMAAMFAGLNLLITGSVAIWSAIGMGAIWTFLTWFTGRGGPGWD